MSTIANRIGPADNGRVMTLEEFLEAEFEEDFRYELGRGVIEMTQVPNSIHRQVLSNLSKLIVIYELARPDVILCRGNGSEFRLWMPGMLSERHPDFAVVLRATPEDERGDRSPSLVVEVVSPRSADRDYRVKREEYLAYGIDEYWIVDYLERRMTLLVRAGTVWVERKVEEGRPIPSVVLPGFAATLADFWVDLEKFKDQG